MDLKRNDLDVWAVELRSQDWWLTREAMRGFWKLFVIQLLQVSWKGFVQKKSYMLTSLETQCNIFVVDHAVKVCWLLERWCSAFCRVKSIFKQVINHQTHVEHPTIAEISRDPAILPNAIAIIAKCTECQDVARSTILSAGFDETCQGM